MFARLVQPSINYVRFRLAPIQVLAALLLADLGFILLHILFTNKVPFFTYWRFGIGSDRGIAANFLYLQEAAVVVLAVVLYLNYRRQFVIGVLAAMFAYIFIDDAFLMHEYLGVVLAEAVTLPTMGSMRPRDMGEIIVFGAFGVLFAGLLALAWLRGDTGERRVAQVLLGLLAALGFCGVGFDAMHMIFDSPALDMPFALLEDGGEMVVISFFLYYTLRLLHEDRQRAGLLR